MTQEEIEKAAERYETKNYISNYTEGLYEGFIAGANSRHPEIEELVYALGMLMDILEQNASGEYWYTLRHRNYTHEILKRYGYGKGT